MKKEELLKEKQRLELVLEEIENQKKKRQNELAVLEKEKQDVSNRFSSDFYEMDDEEAWGQGDAIAEIENAQNATKHLIERLSRQAYSPYFGRIDFAEKEQPSKQYYIGVNNLVKQGQEIPLVCDWRAPVSSLFYDYELGDASYLAPDGKIEGVIELKRQYQIKNKKLKGAFDSSLTIGDDILKKVLSSAGAQKMKTIVSTIQKEQNKIIRDSRFKNVLVQGVAGSGKTSIALHRIAYLLYQNKNTLKAEDVLILSPNKLFSEYIADVLPELGEENISQISYYELAQKELDFLGAKLEKREDCINCLIKNNQRLNEVAYKHSYDFYESLNQFCAAYFDLVFEPQDIKLGKERVKAEELKKLYCETYKTKTPAIRVEWIVDYIIDKFNINTAVQEIAERLKKIIYPFFAENNILKIYADFLANNGMSFCQTADWKIKYEDVGALLYIKNFFFGMEKRKEVKYLVVDEMQDYSFVDYSVFNQIFDCNKIVLGDINQCVEKIMTNSKVWKTWWSCWNCKKTSSRGCCWNF